MTRINPKTLTTLKQTENYPLTNYPTENQVRQESLRTRVVNYEWKVDLTLILHLKTGPDFQGITQNRILS